MHAYLFDKNYVTISSLNDNNVLKDFFALGLRADYISKPKIVTINNIDYIAQIQPLNTKNGNILLCLQTTVRL